MGTLEVGPTRDVHPFAPSQVGDCVIDPFGAGGGFVLSLPSPDVQGECLDVDDIDHDQGGSIGASEGIDVLLLARSDLVQHERQNLGFIAPGVVAPGRTAVSGAHLGFQICLVRGVGLTKFQYPLGRLPEPHS